MQPSYAPKQMCSKCDKPMEQWRMCRKPVCLECKRILALENAKKYKKSKIKGGNKAWKKL